MGNKLRENRFITNGCSHSPSASFKCPLICKHVLHRWTLTCNNRQWGVKAVKTDIFSIIYQRRVLHSRSDLSSLSKPVHDCGRNIVSCLVVDAFNIDHLNSFLVELSQC